MLIVHIKCAKLTWSEKKKYDIGHYETNGILSSLREEHSGNEGKNTSHFICFYPSLRVLKNKCLYLSCTL